MPHDKAGLASRTPWLPRPAGTPRQGSRQGPAKGPAPTSLPLELISTSIGTLGPLSDEKERQQGEGGAGGRREQKKRQMFFQRSQGSKPLPDIPDPMHRNRFECRDPIGTLPGTPWKCALRIPLKTPPLDRSRLRQRSLAEALFFIGAAAKGPETATAQEMQ